MCRSCSHLSLFVSFGRPITTMHVELRMSALKLEGMVGNLICLIGGWRVDCDCE